MANSVTLKLKSCGYGVLKNLLFGSACKHLEKRFKFPFAHALLKCSDLCLSSRAGFCIGNVNIEVVFHVAFNFCLSVAED